MKRILSKITPAVKHLFLINIFVYLIISVLDNIFDVRGSIEIFGAYTFISAEFNPIQILTHMFMHDINVLHIIGNMIFFLLYTPNFERKYGYRLTVISYIFFGIISYLCFSIGINREQHVAIGSSGAVIGFCVVFLFNNLRNWKKIIYNVLVLLLVLDIYSLFQQTEVQYHITAYGHLGGVIGGIIIFLYIQYKRAKKALSF